MFDGLEETCWNSDQVHSQLSTPLTCSYERCLHSFHIPFMEIYHRDAAITYFTSCCDLSFDAKFPWLTIFVVLPDSPHSSQTKLMKCFPVEYTAANTGTFDQQKMF